MVCNDVLELSAVVRREGKLYVALCPEFDVVVRARVLKKR